MGIPIELPASPAPKSGPCHSAKPSWSGSTQHFPPSSSSSSSSLVSASSSSLSSSSSSSYSNSFPVVPPALSLARQQLLQDTRPPLTSLAYHPPPPHSQSALTQQRTLSSPSSAYGSYHSFPSPFPSLGSNDPSIDQSTWVQQARADVAAASVSASLSTTAAVVDEAEIQSPSPARAARPPNLRRISRVPVFVTSPSGSGSGSGSGSTGTANTLSVGPIPVASPMTSTFNSDYYSTTLVSGTTAATSNMEGSMMADSPPPASQPRPIWHPSSPSLVHYLTRPLPPLPRPTSASSSTSTMSHTVEPYPHQLQSYQQEQQEQPPQEHASWNYRFVNMNHADNYNRPETNTLSGSGMMHGYYYEDDRLRHDHSPIMRSYHQQHYQSADSLSTGGTSAATTMTGRTGPADSSANANVTVFSSSPTSVLAPRPRQYYSMRGGSEVIDSDDIDEEWILQQQQQQNQQQQHLSERRFRHRPSLANRERELHLQREQHLHHHHLHHGQTTLSPPPLLSPSSPLSPSNSPSSSSSSNSSTTLMTSVPSFLQGHPTVARTVIRADAFHQGVIHIYPENHAPIRMYGRPIIAPTPPPLHTRSTFSSSSSTPRSSDAAVATLSSVSSTDSNDYVATVVDQGYDNDLTVHIPARPLATPPSSAGSLSSATILSTSSSVVLSPIPSLPPPAVTTTTSLSTLVSQEIIETTTPSSFTSRLDEEGIPTPLLARPASAALSPVLTSGELYRFSSSSSIPSPSSARVYSGSPQTPSSSMSLTLLQPSTMQVSWSQSVALSAEGEEDTGKEGFDELSASESHHHQHHRADHGAPLLSGEQDQQPPV